MEFGIAPNTQIGRIIIPEQVYKYENVYKIEEEKYSRGGEFVENLVTDNIIEYCKRWFNLAGISEFIEDIDEFYDSRGLGKYSNIVKAGFNGIADIPFIPVSSGKEIPFKFTNQKIESPITFNIPITNELRKEIANIYE